MLNGWSPCRRCTCSPPTTMLTTFDTLPDCGPPSAGSQLHVLPFSLAASPVMVSADDRFFGGISAGGTPDSDVAINAPEAFIDNVVVDTVPTENISAGDAAANNTPVYPFDPQQLVSPPPTPARIVPPLYPRPVSAPPVPDDYYERLIPGAL